MNRTTLFVLSLALVLAACGDRPQQADSSSVAAASAESSGELPDPCDLLTPGMISAQAGVAEGELEWRSVEDGCVYSWPTGLARFGPMSVFASEAEAEEAFTESFRMMEEDEADEMLARAQSLIDDAVARGEITREEALAHRVEAQIRRDEATTVNYESVGGIGDRALYDGTLRSTETPGGGQIVSAASNLGVRVRNVVFVISADVIRPEGPEALTRGPSDAELRRNREFTLGLGRRVVERMIEVGA